MTRPTPAPEKWVRVYFFPSTSSGKNRPGPIFLPVLLALAAGCTTPYQAKGFQGGFSVSQVADDAFWIEFDSNVGVEAKTVEQSLLRRAAELTLEQGFKHFVVVSRSRQAGLGFVLRPGLIGPKRRTERAILIRCSGPLGEPGAIDADAFLQTPTGPQTL